MWIYYLAIPSAQGPITWSRMGVVAMIYTGLIASALAWFLWNYILVNMEAGKASIAVMAVPAVGVLSGVIFLGEPMTWSIALGMLILFAGILIVLGLGEKK
jgi:drug/metabolite transporter (DMT)-like permease